VVFTAKNEKGPIFIGGALEALDGFGLNKLWCCCVLLVYKRKYPNDFVPLNSVSIITVMLSPDMIDLKVHSQSLIYQCSLYRIQASTFEDKVSAASSHWMEVNDPSISA
jgi:hypothetical protein